MKNTKLKLNKKLFIATMVLAFVMSVMSIVLDISSLKLIDEVINGLYTDQKICTILFFILNVLLFIGLIVLGTAILLKQEKKEESGKWLLFLMVTYYVCFGLTIAISSLPPVISEICVIYDIFNETLITNILLIAMFVVSIIALIMLFCKNKFKIIRILSIACSFVIITCYIFAKEYNSNISFLYVGSVIAFNVSALISLFSMKEVKEESNEKEVIEK